MDELSENISHNPPSPNLFDRMKAHLYVQLHETYMSKFILRYAVDRWGGRGGA